VAARIDIILSNKLVWQTTGVVVYAVRFSSDRKKEQISENAGWLHLRRTAANIRLHHGPTRNRAKIGPRSSGPI